MIAKRLTKYSFIEKSKKVHDDYFDYSLVFYKNNNTKIKIICPEHGVFEQLPRTHSSGTGCRKCKFDNYKTSEDKLLKQFKKSHEDKYDYSKVKYNGAHKKVIIICPIHGEFKQTPETHIKCGCNKCGSDKLRLTTNEVINQFNNVHNNTYDYSKVVYTKNHSKIDIICSKHGLFQQTSHNHKKGKGCPVCRESKGEIYVRNWLISENVVFESQKRFKDCNHKKPLPFDFYLPKYNICIEYNGIQHYKTTKNNFFGGKKELLKRQSGDKIKIDYCNKNNIDLIIVKYDENVNEILNSFFAIYKVK